jgi:hypothetical protein
MLSATAALVPGAGGLRTLVVTGDAANDDIVITQQRIPNTTALLPLVDVRDNTTGRTVGTFAIGTFSAIQVNGNAGNDRVTNDTAFRVAVSGGDGNDFFRAGTDADAFTGGSGQDVLSRNGKRAAFADNTPGQKDLAAGLLPRGARLTPAELKAQGTLTVSLEGNRLVFAGPTGAGFALRSNWTGSTAAGRFSTNAAVVLETNAGDLTVVPASSVATTVDVGNAQHGAAEFRTIRWGVLPGSGGIQGNPLNGYIDQAANAAGLDVNLPGANWGIGLGNQVRVLDSSAPVNNAVPYLFARMSSGYEVSYGDVKVTTPQSFSGTFVIAPGDGTTYAAVTGLPVVGDLAIAVSPSGYLPYTPKTRPDGAADPEILGHFYSRGQLSLSKARIPAAVRGELVLDLDANDDGKLVGLNSTNIADGITGVINGLKTDPRGTLMNTASALVRDIAVGFNGGLDLELESITMALGEASAWYKPGEIAFRANITNPFRNEPILKDLWSGARFDVQGRMDFRAGKRDWNFKATVASGRVFGFGTAGGSLEAGNTVLGGGGIRAAVSLSGAAGLSGVASAAGTVAFHGEIKFNGDFRLSGVAILAANLGSVVGGTAIGTLELARQSGVFTAKGTLVASLFADIKIAGVGAIGTLSFNLTAGPDGRVRYSGSGSLSVGGHIFGIPAGSAFVGFSFDNTGLTLNFPNPIGTQRINF